jgi:hypothetical protein
MCAERASRRIAVRACACSSCGQGPLGDLFCNCSSNGGKAIRLTDSIAPPPLIPWQRSRVSLPSAFREEDEDSCWETATPVQSSPASLLSAFSEGDEEVDEDCEEMAGALGRAEEEGTVWAKGREDVGEEGKPAALLLRDVDLRGVEFSQDVGPSLHPPRRHTQTPGLL